MFPTQFARKMVAEVQLFFVFPATLDMLSVMMRIDVPE